MTTTYENAAEILRAFLKKGRSRITPERFEVLDAVLEHEGHFSADELYIRMKNASSEVSRATVYNTLEILSQCGLISQCNFDDNTKRYEHNFKRQNHHHLICLDCGRIVEFVNQKITEAQQDICEGLGFEASAHSFNIFARCKNKENCPHYNGPKNSVQR